MVAGLAQIPLCEPRLIDRSYTVRIIAEIIADAPCPPAAIAQKQRYRIVSLPRHDPRRPNEITIVDRDLDVIAVRDAQALRQGWTNRDHIAPSQRRQRLR